MVKGMNGIGGPLKCQVTGCNSGKIFAKVMKCIKMQCKSVLFILCHKIKSAEDSLLDAVASKHYRKFLLLALLMVTFF